MNYPRFRRAFWVSLVLGLVILTVATRRAAADDLDPDQIKAILHTTTAEENGFIDKTVSMVNAGSLPRDLFSSTFIWARRKSNHRFQYFKAALTARAAAVGITL